MKELYLKWLDACKEKGLHNELVSIQDNEEEISDRFYRSLAFGTGDFAVR